MSKCKAFNPKLIRQLQSHAFYSVRHSKRNQLELIPWNSTAALTVYKEKSVDYFKTRVTGVVTWYEHFTGLNDVKIAQTRVLEATQLLKDAHDRRREARVPVAEVQKKLQDIVPELRNTPRNDDRYMQLVKEEHNLLKEEKYLLDRLQEAEKAERDAFEFLSSSLRSSHETERAQAERTKYWSLIASIIGTAIGVAGSTWNNNHKMKKLQNLVNEKSKPEHLQSLIQSQLEDFAVKYSVKDDLNRIYDILREERKFLESHLIKTVAVSSDANFDFSHQLPLNADETKLAKEVISPNVADERKTLFVVGAFTAFCLLNIALRFVQ